MSKDQPTVVPRLFARSRTVRMRWLREQGGDNCYLCGEVMDFVTKDHPRSATIDHVNPKARGGSDHPSNLKLAHLLCNGLRGTSSPIDFRAPVVLRLPLAARNKLTAMAEVRGTSISNVIVDLLECVNDAR